MKWELQMEIIDNNYVNNRQIEQRVYVKRERQEWSRDPDFPVIFHVCRPYLSVSTLKWAVSSLQFT